MADSVKDETTGRNPAGEMLSFTLETQVERAKAERAGDRFGLSLVKHRDFTVTLLLLRMGAHLQEHRARGSISVQVLSGAIQFIAAGEERSLTAGMLCVLDKEVPHSVKALEESTLLLTAALPG